MCVWEWVYMSVWVHAVMFLWCVVVFLVASWWRRGSSRTSRYYSFLWTSVFSLLPQSSCRKNKVSISAEIKAAPVLVTKSFDIGCMAFVSMSVQTTKHNNYYVITQCNKQPRSLLLDQRSPESTLMQLTTLLLAVWDLSRQLCGPFAVCGSTPGLTEPIITLTSPVRSVNSCQLNHSTFW